LRHIYISHILNNNLYKNENDKKRISSLMAHSVQTQSIYRKIPQTQLQEDIIINYKNYNKRNYSKYTKYFDDEDKKKKRNEDKRNWYEKNKLKLAEKRKEKNEMGKK
jgi:hypothetical protein